MNLREVLGPGWHGRYILDEDGEPVVCDDLLMWGQWFNDVDHRRVLQEYRTGKVWISTVFLGLDHNFTHAGPPVLWETMIFGGVLNEYQARYTSRLDALRGHMVAVSLVELYQHCPRRLKKAMRKFFYIDPRYWRHRRASVPLVVGDARLLHRAFARVGFLR